MEWTKEQMDLLQLRHNRLVDKVRKMRGYQKEYFKYRIGSDLKVAKKFEREVDFIIKEEVERQKANQKELF